MKQERKETKHKRKKQKKQASRKVMKQEALGMFRR